MFNLIKTQWVGILAVALLAFVILTQGGDSVQAPTNLGGTAVTTISNPWLFQDGFRVTARTITADTTLTRQDSGKVISIGTAGVDLTLPLASASAGVTYRVVVSAAFATTNMTINGGALDATDDVIFGSFEVAGAVVLCAARDTVSFVSTAELPGDFVLIYSNGTSWFVTGQAGTVAGLTCTDVN